MALLTFALVFSAAIILYLDALSIYAISRDETISNGQKITYFVLTIGVPLLGAMMALRFVAEFSPEAMPPAWLVRPFRALIFPKPIRRNEYPDEQDSWATGSSSASRGHRENDVSDD